MATIQYEIKNPEVFRNQADTRSLPDEVIAIAEATGINLFRQSEYVWSDKMNDVWLAHLDDENTLSLQRRSFNISERSQERYNRLEAFFSSGTRATTRLD
jgi:hypothetical protein